MIRDALANLVAKIAGFLLVFSIIFLGIKIGFTNYAQKEIANAAADIAEEFKERAGANSVDVDVYSYNNAFIDPFYSDYFVLLTAHVDNMTTKSVDAWLRILSNGKEKLQHTGGWGNYSDKDYFVYSRQISVPFSNYDIGCIATVTNGKRAYCLYSDYGRHIELREKNMKTIIVQNGREMYTVRWALVAVVSLVIFISLIPGYKSRKIKIDANNLAWKQKQRENQLIDFYTECEKNNLKECKKESEIQKAKLIADNRKLIYTDIVETFYEAKKAKEKEKEEKERNIEINRVNELKKEEKEKCAELEKYASFNGREKRNRILEDMHQEALHEAKTSEAVSRAFYNSIQQNEHDWAALGGMASGIAGSAAGVATALDAQAKNAQIRAQNDVNRKAFAPIISEMDDTASFWRKEAKKIRENIDKLKTKLVLENCAEDCFSHISFSNTAINVSETGTCTVTTEAVLAKPMIIYEDIDAIVDGNIIAQIFDGKDIIGEAKLVLPLYGIGKTGVKLTGMSLYCGNQDKKYRVEFKVGNLWAMER